MKLRTKRFFFLLITLLYLCTGLLTLIGFLAPFFTVYLLSSFQFTPIAAMYLLPVHLAALLYCGWKIPRWGLIPLLFLTLSCIVLLEDYNWQSPESNQENGLRVVSFNVRTFSYNLSNVDSVAHLLQSLQPDVVCLQEFRNNQLADSLRAMEYLSRALDLPYYRFTLLPVHIQGGAIFSRYPIEGVDTLFMSADEINSGVIATLSTPAGKIGIANIHMSSFRVEGTLKRYSRWIDKLRAVRYQAQTTLRRQQEKVNAILEKTESYPHPLILTADMNAVAHTRITTQLTRHFRDSFCLKGQGLGWSYPLIGKAGLRIDYQLISQEWDVLDLKVITSPISDHYPLLGVYRLKQ
jgi:endonuclease/exonuclease/phosphatase (EEP) superfamily protein YafD